MTCCDSGVVSGAHIDALPFPGMTRKCHEDAVTRWTANTFEEAAILEEAVASFVKLFEILRPS
jgi:hypothetical protein